MTRQTLTLRASTAVGLILALFATLLPVSAPAKDKAIVGRFIAYELVSTSPPADSATGVSFELQGLWGSPNDVPDLFGFTRDDLIAARIAYRQRQHLPPDAIVLKGVEDWFPKDPQGLRWINPFMSPDGKTGLFAFRVTARNGTDRMLRMRDARVYLQTSENGEAIAPSKDLDFYEQWLLGKEVAMNNRKEGPLAAIQSGYVIRHVPYLVGVPGAILAQKIPSWSAANLMEKEVPAGASGMGYLLFPVEMGAESTSVVLSPPEGPAARTTSSASTANFLYRKVVRTYQWDRATHRWVPLPE